MPQRLVEINSSHVYLKPPIIEVKTQLAIRRVGLPLRHRSEIAGARPTTKSNQVFWADGTHAEIGTFTSPIGNAILISHCQLFAVLIDPPPQTA
jgi:hypothetical protein